jgi:NADPH2:quinone reductase
MLIIEAGEFGGPEVLVPRQVPDPVPVPGHVVVRVAAADVLFVDTLIRSGLAVDFFPIRPPYVPGNGVAGLVTATAEGADPSWAGRAVVARTGGNGGWGGYVEQAVVSVSELIPVPDDLSLPEAGALLHDGATAESLLERAAVRPGESVLVTAAAGGMGVVLIELASAAGARVIGAARGARKLEVVRAAGADLALDYSEPDWPNQVHEFTDGRGADVVFDGAGGQLGGAAFGATAVGGRFSAHGVSDGGFAAINPQEAAQRGITVQGIPQHEPADLRRLAGIALADAAAGRIRPVIGQTFPLERAADAHAALAARTAIAKTLLLT